VLFNNLVEHWVDHRQGVVDLCHFAVDRLAEERYLDSRYFVVAEVVDTAGDGSFVVGEQGVADKRGYLHPAVVHGSHSVGADFVDCWLCLLVVVVDY